MTTQMNVEVPMQPRPVALRPLILPSEHGGWGFLFEPVVLGIAVAPSWSGGLVALAALFAFLARQPLKLAWQDAMRGRRYPRTPYCWRFAGSCGLAAALALAAAVASADARILIPLGLVVPLGLVQLLYDAYNRSRELPAEMSGAAAMSSAAAAVAIAGGMPIPAALALSGILLARSLPSILYVRALLRGGLLRGGRAWSAIAAHAIAIAAVASFAPPLVVVAMAVLLARAAWGVAHDAPPAKTIGWREIAFGAMLVSVAAFEYGSLFTRT